MKKILFLLALFACTLAGNAQNTFTKASYALWNLDTTSFSGTTSGGVAYGESKSLALNANRTVVFEILVAAKHDTLASGGLTLWSSMDNATWTKVNMNSGVTPSPIHITRTPLFTYSGTWPAISQPALSVSALGTAAAWSAADTIALGTNTIIAGKAVLYRVTLYNPLFNYYKWSYTAAKQADTQATLVNFMTRYWLKLPY